MRLDKLDVRSAGRAAQPVRRQHWASAYIGSSVADVARPGRLGLVGATVGLLLAVVGFAVGPASAEPPPFQVLTPGGVGTLVEDLPVNVVLVGYDAGTGPRQIDPGRLLADQAPVAAGVSRFLAYFGEIHPTYTAQFPDYRVTFASDTFDDDFFSFLTATGESMPLTRYQQLYNEQSIRTETVADNLTIDAPTVERWLGEHAPELGVDPTEPTVFFVNWFGRPDFRFHRYAKHGSTDSDSGRDFGVLDSRQVIAWGGTPNPEGHRIWFHDLSAGPESNTENWDLVNADVDGDGVSDYRMPPVWEYGSDAGYRSFDDLSGDLGKLLRYVHLDLLVGPSPLYHPSISPPLLPETFGVDLTRVRAAGQPAAPVDGPVLLSRLEELQPWNDFRLVERSTPYSGRIRAVNRCWRTAWTDFNVVGDSCFGSRAGGIAYYDMFLHVFDHVDQFTSPGPEHSIPTLLFEVPATEALPLARAVAEPNYYTGEQFDIASYQVPAATEAGIGQTDTLVHEVGHHLGLSHVHDGLDFSSGRFLDASGDFFFLWTGDESATVMSYLDLANEFGQFDRDNAGRWLTAAYLNQANQVLARIVTKRSWSTHQERLVEADDRALAAIGEIGERDYVAGARLAKQAYDLLLDVAADLNIVIEPQARPADDKAFGRSTMFVDPVPVQITGRPVSTPSDRVVSLRSIPIPRGSGTGWVVRD